MLIVFVTWRKPLVFGSVRRVNNFKRLGSDLDFSESAVDQSGSQYPPDTPAHPVPACSIRHQSAPRCRHTRIDYIGVRVQEMVTKYLCRFFNKGVGGHDRVS